MGMSFTVCCAMFCVLVAQVYGEYCRQLGILATAAIALGLVTGATRCGCESHRAQTRQPCCAVMASLRDALMRRHVPAGQGVFLASEWWLALWSRATNQAAAQ